VEADRLGAEDDEQPLFLPMPALMATAGACQTTSTTERLKQVR
jgi:hypothetical protein